MLRVTVRVRTAAKPMALDDALEAPSLRGPGHLHPITRGEDVHLYHVANLVRRNFSFLPRCVVETEAAQYPRRCLETSFRGVSQFRLRRAATARVALT